MPPEVKEGVWLSVRTKGIVGIQGSVCVYELNPAHNLRRLNGLSQGMNLKAASELLDRLPKMLSQVNNTGRTHATAVSSLRC